MGFHGRRFSVKTSRITARSREVLILLFSFVVTTLFHRCSVPNMAWDPLASVGRMLTILVYLLAAQTALAFIVHVSLRRLASMLTTHSLPADVQMFSATKCLPANVCCSGTVKRISRIRSVERTVSSRPRIGGRAIDLVNHQESSLALSNRGALT